MNDTDVRDAEVEAFVAAVRVALDDLPEGVVDELVDGLAADLAETRAERGEPLDRAVGSPRSYATELRSAAGLPPRTEPPREAARMPLAQWVAQGVARLAQVPVVRPVWQLVVELRPAWWVVRAYVAVGLALLVTVEDPLRHFPVLTAGRGVGGILAAALLLVVATAGSVWLGRRSLSGVLRVLVIAANVFAIYVGYTLLIDGAQPRIVYPAVPEIQPGQMSGLDAVPDLSRQELLDG